MPESIANPCKEEEVTFQNGNVILSGTLLTPFGTEGPHPAIILIHGAGGMDPHAGSNLRESYRDLAGHFASRGITALIYDKRGAGRSSGDVSQRSFDNLADDALSGLKLLQQRKNISSEQVGLWGLSQGGWLAPFAASRSKDVAFVIPVSGPGVSPEEQELYRAGHDLPAKGFSQDEVRDAVVFMKLKFRVARTGEGWDELEALSMNAQNERWLPEVLPPSSMEELRQKWDGMWAYDPVPVLERISCPILAIFGELDTVVPVEKSVDIMRKAFQTGGNRDYAIEVFPQANHGLQLPNGDYAAEYLESMSDWIRKRVHLSG